MGKVFGKLKKSNNIKLTYFDFTGRAEVSRIILTYAGVKFTDERITDLAAIKEKLPFGQLPVLYYKGVQISQSMAIARFLANEFKLAGRNNLERAQADEIVDALVDLFNKGFEVMFSQGSAEETQKLRKEYHRTVDTELEKLERRLETRGGQFFAGNALTWADIQFFCAVDFLRMMESTAVEKYPLLADLNKRIGEIPNIKQWMETRPQGGH